MDTLRQRNAYSRYSTLYDMLELAIENFNKNFHGTNKKQVEDASLRLKDAYIIVKECFPSESITMVIVKNAHIDILDSATLAIKEFTELEYL